MVCETFCNNCRVYRSVSDEFDSDHKAVVMDCTFPSKKERQGVFQKKTRSKSCNIKSLKNDEGVIKCYSDALDIALENVRESDNIDALSDKITTSIQKSSDSSILSKDRSTDNRPWVDETFLHLIEDRNKSKKGEERLALNKEVKKYRDKIKNEYFEKKADDINMASESRDVEEEFRLENNYSSLNKAKRLVIAPEKLTSHFEKHFSPRDVTVQPEIENPDLFPHILPPGNITVNENIPNVDELRKVVKKQKDNKFQGTDRIIF